MLTEANQVTFDRLADVFGCFRPGVALGNASGKRRTTCDKNSVLVRFKIDSVLHYLKSSQRRDGGPNLAKGDIAFPKCGFKAEVRLRRVWASYP